MNFAHILYILIKISINKKKKKALSKIYLCYQKIKIIICEIIVKSKAQEKKSCFRKQACWKLVVYVLVDPGITLLNMSCAPASMCKYVFCSLTSAGHQNNDLQSHEAWGAGQAKLKIHLWEPRSIYLLHNEPSYTSPYLLKRQSIVHVTLR